MLGFVQRVKRNEHVVAEARVTHACVQFVFDEQACRTEFGRLEIRESAHRTLELRRVPQMLELIAGKTNLPVSDGDRSRDHDGGNRGGNCRYRFP